MTWRFPQIEKKFPHIDRNFPRTTSTNQRINLRARLDKLKCPSVTSKCPRDARTPPLVRTINPHVEAMFPPVGLTIQLVMAQSPTLVKPIAP
jgi:hypothetical protein